MLSVVGSDATQGNTGRLLIGLKPLESRKDSADTIINQVRALTQAVQGIEFVMRNPPAIDIGPQASSTAVQYLLQSTDTASLYAASDTFLQRLEKIPELRDVRTSLRLRNPEIRVVIDRDQAAALGVSPARIQDTLQSAYGGRRISSIFGSTDQYPVYVEVDHRLQKDINVLGALHLSGNTGEIVPLGAVASIRSDVGPLTIDHFGSLPAVTLSFNLAPGVSLGDATTIVNALARSELGPKVTGRFTGSAQAFEDSLRDLPYLLLVTILLIYMIMAVLYEHFAHPITILTALPLAGFGALLMLWICREELNLFSFVRFIFLVGLVKKNGIMMVDFAVELMRGAEAKFRAPREAMLEASLVRFRPIMMTSLAAILGTLPIALGVGAGAEARRPLGIAVVGGLLFSQLLTLYLTPVFFVSMERIVAWSTQRKLASPMVDEVQR